MAEKKRAATTASSGEECVPASPETRVCMCVCVCVRTLPKQNQSWLWQPVFVIVKMKSNNLNTMTEQNSKV